MFDEQCEQIFAAAGEQSRLDCFASLAMTQVL
jgi:hypothetical protein